MQPTRTWQPEPVRYQTPRTIGPRAGTRVTPCAWEHSMSHAWSTGASIWCPHPLSLVIGITPRRTNCPSATHYPPRTAVWSFQSPPPLATGRSTTPQAAPNPSPAPHFHIDSAGERIAEGRGARPRLRLHIHQAGRRHEFNPSPVPARKLEPQGEPGLDAQHAQHCDGGGGRRVGNRWPWSGRWAAH